MLSADSLRYLNNTLIIVCLTKLLLLLLSCCENCLVLSIIIYLLLWAFAISLLKFLTLTDKLYIIVGFIAAPCESSVFKRVPPALPAPPCAFDTNSVQPLCFRFICCCELRSHLAIYLGGARRCFVFFGLFFFCFCFSFCSTKCGAPRMLPQL